MSRVTVDLNLLLDGCAQELSKTRSHSLRFTHLVRAYAYALEHSEGLSGFQYPREDDVTTISSIISDTGLVSPDQSQHGRYRTLPAILPGGFRGSDPEDISQALQDLLSELNIHISSEDWTRRFLILHPFSFNNSLIAWILYNWIGRSLDEPRPLPVFSEYAGVSVPRSGDNL